ncbi:MAG TPA: DegV family protein [Anaerolineaceae bacterium]|nr:DegV family protein [Anaerolineaceae bacterium]HPN52842.1 DegV family protein [Anaerolineaceae bacterium]
MPKNIAIITDSTCDLPEAYRQRYHIYLVPLFINWGTEQFLDGVDLKAEAFYERLEKDRTYPTTSQPSPQDFLKVYQQAKADGADELLVVTISSAMSGTIQSARQAANLIDIPVEVVDSLSNSMSLGWQVLAAARAGTEAGLAGMAAAANEVRKKLVYVISLNTIDYLFKGGRIGGATRFIGSLLNLKPQIMVNHETGKVVPGMPARSREKAIEGVINTFFKKVDITHPMRIAVLHNAAYEEADALARLVEEKYHPVELIESIVSPVLGVHTGPKAIALCGYSE